MKLLRLLYNFLVPIILIRTSYDSFARAAQKPDIEFQISEAAIDEILSQEAPTMAAFGIIVVRQVATQKAQLRLLSSVFPVLTGGYLKIIQKAGPEFVGYLGQFGLKGVSGIRKFIQSMK